MHKYVPKVLPVGSPLVVALHGCHQQARDYDIETGWTKLAQLWKFALLFPEQKEVNNQENCFNWFNGTNPLDTPLWPLSISFPPGSDNERDKGEALSIKQMIDWMKAHHRVDGKRIYVTGLSGGGAMTTVMLAAYPDVFTGGAIIAGVPYGCATDLYQALTVCGVAVTKIFPPAVTDKAPVEWGDAVRRAATSYSGPWPIVSIWHGDQDKTVSPKNAEELMKQWTNVHGIDQHADEENTVAGYPHKVYKDAQGNARVETYTITGMGHGTPVDPKGVNGDRCGVAKDYILDSRICSSYHIGKFWGLDRSAH
jgi:poly(hydroxyalkanoate) depolymerase family esterase